MDATQLLLLSIMLFVIGAFAALLWNGTSRTARIVAGGSGMLASAVSLSAAILSALKKPNLFAMTGAFPFGNFSLQIDSLSAFMVGMISLLGFAASLYSISYLEQYEQRSLGVMGFFTNLFLAGMLLVVTVANAFFFLVFWEMMTLASYFLVIFEHEKKEAIRAGYLYMLVAHAGTALIMVAFFVLYLFAGSFDFAAFRLAQLSPALRNLIFLLGFFGFGAKAGVVPLHIWMPSTYSAAPSHASALMSSVMKKTAIYGILRLCVDFLGVSTLWWGYLVLFFGVLSAVLGVIFALAERDIKRVLAYSSVENIGIILIGVATGMIGLATHQPAVTLLGFLAALYHSLNHAFFKGLLFLGAGSLTYRLHTQDLNQMGGLARRMPWTALAFLTGAMAVAAIPPLNGFVSEWFTYQSLLTAGHSPFFAARVVSPLAAVVLSLVGALAAMAFIKAYSGAFAGPARSQEADQAKEAPSSMLASMAILGLACLALGIGAPLAAPYLSRVAASIPNVSLLPVAKGVWVFPVDDAQALLSTPLSAILLLGLLSVPLAIIALYGGNKAGRRTVQDPWTCGYGYAIQMSITASSFDQPVKATFRILYALRTLVVKPFAAVGRWSRRAREIITRSEPVLEAIITRPTARAVEYLGRQIQVLQMGDIRMYCLYIIFTLAVLLVVIFR